MFLNSSLSCTDAKIDLLPTREREGGGFAACPHPISEKENWCQDQLHQQVQHDAKTHGLMEEMTWTTDIWATCWPLPLFCEGNAAGTSLHHEVLYLQICVSRLLLPPVPLCNCLISASSTPQHTYMLSIQPDMTFKYRKQWKGI